MNCIPDWANEVMIAKGIGFERTEVKTAIWSYFESQFAEFDCEHSLLETYFGHMVDTLIKNGDVDKARRYFDVSDHTESLDRTSKSRPIRRSQISLFEEKAQRLLARYDD